MSDFTMDELLALEALAHTVEVYAFRLVAALYLWAAWRFFRSPRTPPHPLLYRRTPTSYVVAFVFHFFVILARCGINGGLAFVSPFDSRVFLSFILAFISLAGCRRMGEAPLAGMLSATASSALVSLALLQDVSTAAVAAPPTLLSPWFQASRALTLISYGLLFNALALRLSLWLRPPPGDDIRVRGLVASADILTDHPQRCQTLYRAGLPFLFLSIITRIHFNRIFCGHALSWNRELLLQFFLFFACLIHQHLRTDPSDVLGDLDESGLSGPLAVLFLTRYGAAVILLVSLGLFLWLPLLTHHFSDRHSLFGLNAPWPASVALLLASLIPCLLRRSSLRFIEDPEIPSFDVLIAPPSNKPPTKLDIQNPQLLRDDIDNALVLLGFRSFLTAGGDARDGAAFFGTYTRIYGYFAHIFIFLILLFFPFSSWFPCAVSYYPIFEALLAVLAALWLVRAVLPWYLAVYRLKPGTDSCLVTLQVYSGGLTSSPSKMIKALTAHLVMEHESMF